MNIIDIELQNYAGHKSLRTEFSAGLNGVFGGNGAGKSSLLSAVCWLFTGQSLLPGKKADDVYALAPERAESYAVCRFQHAGRLFVLQRWLRPAGKKSILAEQLPTGRSETIATGDTDIRAALGAVFDADLSMLQRLVFVGQDQLFAFINESESVRRDFLIRFFGLDRLMRLHAAITKFMRDMPAVDLPGINNRIQSLEQQLAEISAQISTHCLSDWTPGDALALQELEAATADAASRQSLAHSLGDARRAHDDALRVVAEQQSALVELQRLSQEANKKFQDAEAALQAATAAYREQLSWDEYTAKQSQLYAALKLPQLTAEAVEVERATITRQLVLHEAFMSSVADNQDTCYICSSHVPGLSSKKGAVAAEQAVLRARLDMVKHDAAVRHHLALLQRPPRPGRPTSLRWLEEASQKCAAAYQFERDAAAQLAASVATLSRKVANAEAQAAAYAQTCVAAEQRLQALGKPGASYVELAGRLATLREKQRAAAAADGRRQGLLASEASLRKLLADAQTDKRRATAISEFYKTLEAVRDAVSPNTGVRDALLACMQAVTPCVNQYLQTLRVPFRVEADDSMSFTAVFASGVRQPAARLSGGQKTLLALAFVLAVLVTFVRRFGFLLLDEPTANLSAESAEALLPFLERFKTAAGLHGLQCVFATHVGSLESRCDRAIRLPDSDVGRGASVVAS